jgi:hypothetical protein
MKILAFISLMFILYELLKAIMVDTYWRMACLNKRSTAMRFLDFVYLIFMIFLLFTHYWYVGVVIFIVSIITALQTTDDVIEKTKFNEKIRGYLIADNVVSILLLLIIVFKEIIL